MFPTLDEHRQLARETGFEVTVVDDVTPGLVPSFKVVRKLLQAPAARRWPGPRI